MTTPNDRANELIIICVFSIAVLVALVWALDFDSREVYCQSLHDSRKFHAVPFSPGQCEYKEKKGA